MLTYQNPHGAANTDIYFNFESSYRSGRHLRFQSAQDIRFNPEYTSQEWEFDQKVQVYPGTPPHHD